MNRHKKRSIKGPNNMLYGQYTFPVFVGSRISTVKTPHGARQHVDKGEELLERLLMLKGVRR